MSAVLSFAHSGAASPHQAVAFVADAATAAAVAEALPGVAIRDDGLGAAIGALSQVAPPPAVVVDVSGSEDPAAGIRALASLCGGRTRIVAVGNINDVALYRALREAGAADYMVKPFQRAALAAAVSRPDTENGTESPQRKGPYRLFVCGARGGTGATTVAVNVACTLSRRDGFRVALIDLDLAFGTVALALDIEPSHGLREILDNPDRVDALFVASAAARMGERLSVFAAEEALESDPSPPTSADASLPRLFEALAATTECIVVDVPRATALAHPGLFAHADGLALVVEMNLASARDAARLAMLAREVSPNCAVSLVANKCGKQRKGEIDSESFARGARLEVGHQLPWDEKTAAAAANAGQPIAEAAPSSPLARALAMTAERLVPLPAPAAEAKPSLWKRLAGRG